VSLLDEWLVSQSTALRKCWFTSRPSRKHDRVGNQVRPCWPSFIDKVDPRSFVFSTRLSDLSSRVSQVRGTIVASLGKSIANPLTPTISENDLRVLASSLMVSRL
jgi:hypothetical protein